MSTGFNISIFLQKKVASLGKRWDWLGSKINHLAINRLVNQVRHRPHPWSTAHPYTSWKSLSDRRWSARHLPERDYEKRPSEPSLLAEFFRRPQNTQKLCAKSTVLFPAFAQYLTDGFIRTRMPSADEPQNLRKENTSNHDIDLCTLYGRNESQTNQLRLQSQAPGKKGRLKSQHLGNADGITEEYSPFLFDGNFDHPKTEFDQLDLPLGLSRCADENKPFLFAVGGDRVNSVPQVVMINTLLLREHNRVAGLLENVNPDWDDERVFQTARNILIVIFIKIVVEEYINHISPTPIPLRADPSVAWDAPWNKTNWITTEFSLLYRWHSLVPDQISWSNQPYPAGATFFNNSLLLNAGLKRSFIDVSNQPAAQLGAFNTHDHLIAFEQSAIEQGQLCKLDFYNAYREYSGLPRAKNFGDISTNPEVVKFLSTHYTSVDEVEFYIGLFAEDRVKNSPLPPLLLALVAVDAFSQALTNPLLSKHVFNENTFSRIGWELIHQPQSLRRLLQRNTVGGLQPNDRVSFRQANWEYS